MAKKLHYFHMNGVAESIRYILHYAEEKFEDIRYDYNSWSSVKDTLPYGQIPLYEEGNRSLNQSLAIARYLASKTNLLPTDSWEQALLDAAVLNIYDFWEKAKKYAYETDPAKKELIKKNVFDEIIPYYFSRFEKELKSGNGYFGGKLSWADFILIGIIEAGNFLFNEIIEKHYPTVAALVKIIQNLPGVKEYIEAREPYVLPK